MGKTAVKKYSYRTGDEKKCYKLTCSSTNWCEKHQRDTDMEGKKGVMNYTLLLRLSAENLSYTCLHQLQFNVFQGQMHHTLIFIWPLSLSFWKTFPFLLSCKSARGKSAIGSCITDSYAQGRRSRTPAVKAFGEYHWSQIQFWIPSLEIPFCAGHVQMHG